MSRAAAALVAVITVGLGVGFLGAAPAAAHGGPGGEEIPASNYLTSIQAVVPQVDGVEVEVIGAGWQLELSNRTDQDVTVLGYEGEPYLRVGPDGVFENRRSPATYLNRARDAGIEVPAAADADASPEWRRLGGGRTARWHDHRAHWMGGGPPPSVRDAPGDAHVVLPEWTVPVLLGSGETMEIRGDLRWIPGPPRWPWILTAVVGAVAVALAGLRWRVVPAAGCAAVALLSAAAVDIVGVWAVTPGGPTAKFGGAATPVIGVTVAIAGLFQLRRSVTDGLVLLGAVGAGFAWFFGVANLDWLGSSQLPTGAPTVLARATVATSLGAGVGLAVLATVIVVRDGLPGRQVSTASAPKGVTVTRSVNPNPSGLDRAVVRRHRRVLVGGVVLVVGAALVVSSFTDTTDSPVAGDPVTGAALYDRLCTSAALAADDDPGAARELFEGEVHGPLHDLAAATTEVDRDVASRLLEAKQAVEAILVTDSADLDLRLADLAEATREAYAVTGSDVVAPCPSVGPT